MGDITENKPDVVVNSPFANDSEEGYYRGDDKLNDVEEEVSEEEGEKGEKELDEGASEESEEENDGDTEGEDEENSPHMVPHAALHKERERRKEAIAQGQYLYNELEETAAMLGQYEKSLASIKAQLKELGLEDAVNIDEPGNYNPELASQRNAQREQMAQQNVVKTVIDLRDTASGFIEEFPLIDGSSAEQAEIVVGLALASMYFGQSQEDAVMHAMKLLNNSLGSQRKAAIRQSKPVSKKVTSSPSGVRKQKAVQVRVSSGNVKSFFDKMAEDRFG